MRFQVASKLIRPNSWIMQTVRQRIPNCWARNGESTSAKSAAMDAWNDELTATGGSQMLAPPVRGNFNVVNHIAHSSCFHFIFISFFSGCITIGRHEDAKISWVRFNWPIILYIARGLPYLTLWGRHVNMPSAEALN